MNVVQGFLNVVMTLFCRLNLMLNEKLQKCLFNIDILFSLKNLASSLQQTSCKNYYRRETIIILPILIKMSLMG